ncbi:MAG: ABC transporter ATP-binding protein [Chloroflexota bacterium]|nr:ABC transporter ATP-binding protein [Chloroflexota bacterium]
MSIALEARALARSFGGIRAVRGVDLRVDEGSITAIIGPNGAGKTTLFNLLTALVPPDAGSAELFGERIVGLDPAAIARRGLVRTFQTARVLPGLTTLENALIGAHRRVRSSIGAQAMRLGGASAEERELAREARSLLETVGLAARVDDAATDLPAGSQKLLELVRALMAAPRVLLLDEPAAGSNDAEVRELAAVLRATRDAGITLVVVEHNMSLVMDLADQVVCLDLGQVICAGAPSVVQADRRVIDAYLGQPT